MLSVFPPEFFCRLHGGEGGVMKEPVRFPLLLLLLLLLAGERKKRICRPMPGCCAAGEKGWEGRGKGEGERETTDGFFSLFFPGSISIGDLREEKEPFSGGVIHQGVDSPGLGMPVHIERVDAEFVTPQVKIFLPHGLVDVGSTGIAGECMRSRPASRDDPVAGAYAFIKIDGIGRPRDFRRGTGLDSDSGCIVISIVA